MPEPIYQQIADDLRSQIQSRQIPPGSQLPTELQLREKYGASRNTIRDALNRLVILGLVETRPGRGTFVVEKFEPFITTLSGDWQTDSGLGGGEGNAALAEVNARERTAKASTPRVEVKQAAGYVADRLQVAPGAQVISRHQERYIDDQPWSLQTSFYPMEFVLQGATRLLEAADIDEGTVEYLSVALNLKQVGYRDLIAVRSPDQNETNFFRLPADGRVPVFVLLRTGFAEDPAGVKAFRLTESVFPSDRNQFVINAGEVPDRLGSAADV
ncbi:MAG TPA: GntR family transcriptional regulator [Streptosporangiaceae bacterium]|jgi:GntR family transcriptional regulator|nr:GntR family transcriptional regulator [Streptosporangiaceae bacterium]